LAYLSAFVSDTVPSYTSTDVGSDLGQQWILWHHCVHQ